MNAAELARKLKREEKAKQAEDRRVNKRNAECRQKRKEEMALWIEEVLGSFKMKIKQDYWGGRDRWSLMKRDKTLVTCTLSYEHGTFNGSDECCDIPYEGWEIQVSRGVWNRDNVIQGGITDKERLEEYVAKIMKDYV